MKKIVGIVIFLLLICGLSFLFFYSKAFFNNPLVKIKPKPFLVYTFENLKKTTFSQNQITLGHTVKNNSSDFVSQIFYFNAMVKPGSSEIKKISGLINIPKAPGTYPVIVMFRGFIPKESYKPGVGTQPAARVFAQNGFITLAPDFLGYGESDKPSKDGFEDRFQTYTTALSLLSSLQTLNNGLTASYSGSIKANLSKIGIWGHSNGGHIALATLAVGGISYPTVLWAPVSKSFPYSILYYTDETDDQGKALRKALAQFEENYNTDLFSPPRYYQWIKAPIEIDQGTSDQEVPMWWSDDLSATLKKQGIDTTYLTYPDADHNLLPTGWLQAVQNDIDFFNKHL